MRRTSETVSLMPRRSRPAGRLRAGRRTSRVCTVSTCRPRPASAGPRPSCRSLRRRRRSCSRAMTSCSWARRRSSTRAGSVHDAADLVRQVRHQVPARTGAAAGRTSRGRPPARRTPSSGSCSVGCSAGAAAGQQPPGLVADLGAAQAQPAHQLVGQRVQQGGPSAASRQPSAGLAEHLGRRRPAPVGQAVHAALQRVAQRSEGHGHDTRPRRAAARSRRGRAASPRRRPRPWRRATARTADSSDVGERLVERERDVVEPALQHRPLRRRPGSAA